MGIKKQRNNLAEEMAICLMLTSADKGAAKEFGLTRKECRSLCYGLGLGIALGTGIKDGNYDDAFGECDDVTMSAAIEALCTYSERSDLPVEFVISLEDE